jgi:hypothetical protein
VSSGVSPPRHFHTIQYVSFSPFITPSPRGLITRHIVRQFQSPYTPSPRGLTRISARQVALALASRFSRMLSFQIKDMEFTVNEQGNNDVMNMNAH